MGKTHLLHKLMSNWNAVAAGVPIYKFYLFYQADQKLYDDIFESLPPETIKEKSQQLPEDLNDLLVEPPSKEQYNVLVFDDMQITFEKDKNFLNFVNQLIRVFTHHRRIVPIVSF